MAGSEESPVSTAIISWLTSPKHSAIESNPEFAPKRENQGVQICAGITITSDEIALIFFTKFKALIPKIGLPSEVMLPISESDLLINSATSMEGDKKTM